jgi:hypothetical protein
MPRDDRKEREIHALDKNGMLMCNLRDKEASRRALIGDIATADAEKVTCRKCLVLVFRTKRSKEN